MLGLTTTGTVQFVGIIVAIALTLLWWIRVAPKEPKQGDRLKLSPLAWVGIPLAIVAVGIATLPLLGYASIGIVNATLMASLVPASRP